MANARDKLNARITHQTDVDEAEFNALLDELCADKLREAANGLAILGLVDSLVSGPKAWNEAIETLRRMADETDRSKDDDCPGREAEQTIPW